MSNKRLIDAYRNGRRAYVPSGELDDVIAVYRQWLHLPDVGAIYTALGTVAANMLPGDPVWTLIVGPPSSGKTEAIGPLTALPFVHAASTVTPAALMSGTSKKQAEHGATGGLLPTIGVGGFGMLLMKDFTSVLEQHRDARGEALAALREVYDGRYDRALGTGGGRVLTWYGKCGLIGGVTPAIDRHHAVMATMGERLVLYRIHVTDPAEQARRRLRNRGDENTMRDELARAVLTLFDRFDVDAIPPERVDAETDWLVSLAVFVVKARTGVDRDGYSREVELMPTTEAPGRLVGQLAQLWSGMAALGVPIGEIHRAIGKIAWDSVPEMRKRALVTLYDAGQMTNSMITSSTGIPSTSLVRTLEDLRLLGLVESQKHGEGKTAAVRWWVTDECRAVWPAASPEMSEDTHCINSPLPVLEDFSGEAPEPFDLDESEF